MDASEIKALASIGFIRQYGWHNVLHTKVIRSSIQWSDDNLVRRKMKLQLKNTIGHSKEDKMDEVGRLLAERSCYANSPSRPYK